MKNPGEMVEQGRACGSFEFAPAPEWPRESLATEQLSLWLSRLEGQFC